MDAVLMVKTLVLSALYNLSDDQIEYQIRDRLSFMRFLGLGLECRGPDAKTVWLYRAALAQAGQVEELFCQFDGDLARQGYIARGGQILDASIVPVPRNHNTRDENAAIKGGEGLEDWENKPAKRNQKDADARWTKKPGKSHYGDKNHVNVDRKHKLVRRYHVSDAARHARQAMDHLLMQGNTGSGGWADAAYRSEEYPSGSSYFFCPFSIIAQQGIGEDKQLPYDSGDSDFLLFPRGDQMIVFGFEVCIVLDHDERWHKDGVPQILATSR